MFYVVTIKITSVYLTLAAPGGVSVAAEFIFKGAMNLRPYYNSDGVAAISSVET